MTIFSDIMPCKMLGNIRNLLIYFYNWKEIFYRLLNLYCEIFDTSSYGEGRTRKLVPCERVPNISQCKFNNLFVIYL